MNQIYSDSYLASARNVQNTMRLSYTLAILVAVTILGNTSASDIMLPLIGLTLQKGPALLIAVALFFVLGFSLQFTCKKMYEARDALGADERKALETYPYLVNGGETGILFGIVGLFFVFLITFMFEREALSFYRVLGMSLTLCIGYFYSALVIAYNKWCKRMLKCAA
ncbi:hypothetical protein [Alkalimonas amylolytica]|uniref:Uncharacterized protein n=1 Tax=Alkalimonas amylolytica TaxID=152573 RepID=A0A1H4E9X8_ALKAM|nr:hypothetical protein [Alkalimonas amylolytica]SEA81390.1 hypothetical protein SAMN04488051_106281 [Alkalimonas amylolytica]